MGLFDNVRSRLREANTAMAGAHREWQDAQLESKAQTLSAREEAVRARETEVAEKLAQARKSEQRWFRRKSLYLLIALVTAAVGFVAGLSTGIGQNQDPAIGATLPPTSPKQSKRPAVSENLKPLYPKSSNQPSIESKGRSMSFEQCVATIEGMSDQLGVTPVTIVDTSIFKSVRFPTTDGSVLVSCSRPDNKIVITRSPYN